MKNLFKSILLLFTLALLGCGLSTDDIESETQEEIVKNIADRVGINSSDIKVEDYTLIKESGNTYSGVLKTKYDGVVETFDIEVVYDKSNGEYTYKWEYLGVD